jgi:hypothetical protein
MEVGLAVTHSTLAETLAVAKARQAIAAIAAIAIAIALLNILNPFRTWPRITLWALQKCPKRELTSLL